MALKDSEIVARRDEKWKKIAEHVWPLCRALMDDLWDPEDVKKFLFARPGEPKDAWASRCNVAVLNNYYKPAVRSYAALLSEYRLEDAPESLEESGHDVDLRGNDLRVFLSNVDTEALALGAAVVVVDYNEKLERPYLAMASVDDIYGVRVIVEDGRHFLQSLSIRYEIEVETDGKMECETRYLYYEHRPARCSIWREKGRGDVESVESEKPIKGANGKQLEEIPIIWYSFSSCAVAQVATPPLYSLARLNLLHYNKDSEINTAETVVNAPTVVRTYPGPAPEKTDAITLGINYGIDLPNGGQIRFLEATMSGLTLSHQRQVERQEQMSRLGQEFLSGGNRAKTATEAMLDAQQSKQELNNLAARKQSLVQEIFKLWQVFADPRYTYPDDAGQLIISEEVLDPAPTAQDVAVVEGLFTSGIITRPTALSVLARTGWIEEEELERESKAQELMEQQSEVAAAQAEEERALDIAEKQAKIMATQAKAQEE